MDGVPPLRVPDASLVMRAVLRLLAVMVPGNLAPAMIVAGIGSPCLDGVDGAVYAAEAGYAASQDDPAARVSLGVGEKEAGE